MMSLFGGSSSEPPPDPGKAPPAPTAMDVQETSSHGSKRSVKRFRTKSASSDISFASSISTQNSFSGLEDNVEGPKESSDERHRNAKKAKRETQNNNKENPVLSGIKKEQLPPPITIRNMKIDSLNACLADANVSKEIFNIKFTHYGIKLFADSNQNFQVLKDALVARKIEFFTHQLKEERLSKFVLYGLPNFDVNDVKKELNVVNFFPVEVKTLNIKTSRYDSHTNYIVYFKKSDQIKISQLREIKTLFRVIIYWNFYSHKRNDVTQCSNCQGFGHGTQNCFMKPVCVKCAGPHTSKECPLNAERDVNGKIPDRKLYCVHCTHHHTANYRACTKRKEFVAKQNSLKKPHKKKTFVDAPLLNNANFPSIPAYQNPRTPAWVAETVIKQPPKFHNKNPNDLFTPEECYKIFNEFLSKMSSCKSRQDQLQVIGEITFKYLK